MSSPFDLRLAGFLGDLRVVSFEGSEAMNKLFRFDVRLTVPDADAAGFAEKALEMPATLTMRFGAGDHRAVHGVVTTCQSIALSKAGLALFSLRLEPRMALLKRRRTSRIFQDLTTREIVSTILTHRNVLARWRLARELPKRVYSVQYDETDHAFVTRLLAEDGLMFSFDQPRELSGDESSTGMGQSEVVVIADTAESYAPIDGPYDLAFRGPNSESGLVHDEHHIQGFALHHSVRSKGVLLRGFDAVRPPVPPRDAATTEGAPRIERIESMRTLAKQPMTIHEPQHTREQARLTPVAAATYLEAERASARLADGQSNCRRLLPGRKFRLAEHELADLDGEYVIVSCHHVGWAPEAAPPGAAVYANDFSCAPAEVPQRPRRPRIRPRQTLETAIVTGPPGQEIHTDELGRVKVQFHWDLDGELDERSSCWLRVAQAWAGAGFGAQFVPRIGAEVLVSFIAGDPDRPVVTGCLYNGVASPAFPTPRDKTQSGFRTRSSPGGVGGNELLFDDAAGAELVSLRGQRNMSLASGSKLRIEAGADCERSTAGHESTRVGGNLREEISGSRDSSIGGASTSQVAGERQLTVGGDHRMRVGNDDDLRIEGTSRCTVFGDRHVSVGAPRGEAQAASMTVNGFYQVGASEEVLLTSSKRIVFRVGKTSLTLTKDGLLIEGPKLTVAHATVELRPSDRAGYTFGDNLVIKAPVVGLFSDGASLVLDSEAKLDGALVKLNCGGAAAGARASVVTDEPAQAIFQLEDYDRLREGSPISLVISLPTGESVEREVDSGGKVVLDGHKGERFKLTDIRRDGRSIPGKVVS